MNVHIGEKVKKRAKELRIGPTELAGLINTSRQNIAGIYRRPSLDSQLLYDLSKALDYNFFSFYDTSKLSGHEGGAKEADVLRKENKALLKEVELLRENNDLLKALLQKEDKKPTKK